MRLAALISVNHFGNNNSAWIGCLSDKLKISDRKVVSRSLCYVYTWPAIFINGHFNLSVFKNKHRAQLSVFRKCSFTRPRVYMPSRARQTCRWRCNEKLKPTLANQNPENSNNSNESLPLSLSLGCLNLCLFQFTCKRANEDFKNLHSGRSF